MSCVEGKTDRVDFTVIRGDDFELSVALSEGWEEIVENPAGYVARLVFREEQDDALTPLLTIEVEPEPVLPVEPYGASLMAFFIATPAQTQALPDWDIVAYAEVKNDAGTWVRRLFNSRVSMKD